ncbi:MAG: hypothetical protein ACP5U2_08695, partial [Bryobacteraceae bacterium]
MMAKLLALLSAVTLAAVPFHQSGFHAARDGVPEGWRTWSARPETAPKMWVDDVHSRGEPGSLAIS